MKTKNIYFCAILAISASASARGLLELQPYAQTQRVAISGGGAAQLTNVNPSIGGWYVLSVNSPGFNGHVHLESSGGRGAAVELTPTGVVVKSAAGGPCEIFAPGTRITSASGRVRARFFRRLCNTDVWARFSSGANVVDAQIAARVARRAPTGPADPSRAPAAANVRPDAANSPTPSSMNGTAPSVAGKWSPSRYRRGVYFSSIYPEQVASQILQGDRIADPLNGSEARSLASLVALDLSEFTMGWSHGPLLPGVGSWGQMFPYASAPTGADPDGVASLEPFSVRGGVVNPAHLVNLVATMAGGFQRYHGHMRGGGPNAGKYYGFVQEGVVLSTMQPGLATLVISADGRVDVKTWSAEDSRALPTIRYARQNGVPLVERVGDRAVPGQYVSRSHWAAGNWSGSANRDLQTPRSCACLTERNGLRHLVFAYFSSATPSAMARVLQAYDCKKRHASRHEQSGLGVFRLVVKRSGRYVVEHPAAGMASKDSVLSIAGRPTAVPRFVGHADTANPGDFFYFMSRAE